MTTKINNDVNVSDRDKFNQWLEQCPVTIQKRDDCAYGWVEMHFLINDERDEDYSDYV